MRYIVGSSCTIYSMLAPLYGYKGSQKICYIPSLLTINKVFAHLEWIDRQKRLTNRKGQTCQTVPFRGLHYHGIILPNPINKKVPTLFRMSGLIFIC